MPSISHTSRDSINVQQSDASKLNVTVDNFPAQDQFQNLPHYETLIHNTTTVVWTPAAGYKIHLISFVVSTTAAGYILLSDRDPGPPIVDTAFMRLEFNLRQSVPFGINTDLDFDWNHQLVAIYVGDAGTPTAYITAIGHEHNPAAWPP